MLRNMHDQVHLGTILVVYIMRPKTPMKLRRFTLKVMGFTVQIESLTLVVTEICKLELEAEPTHMNRHTRVHGIYY